MLCQECKQRPATMHLTKIINGEKTEVHICEKCAQEKGEMLMIPGNSGFSINDILAGLLSMEPMMAEAKQTSIPQNKVLQCDRCKMTYQEFTNHGRFGCSDCYRAFSSQLTPILKRLHSGNSTHSGKIPKRMGGHLHTRKQMEQLKQQLKEHIVREEFEQAAVIRDQLRALEKEAHGHEGGM